MTHRKRIYLDKDNEKIIEIFRRGRDDSDNTIISFLFKKAIENKSVYNQYQKECQFAEKSLIIKEIKEKSIIDYSDGFQKSRIMKMIMSAICEPYFDINDLYNIIQNEKKIPAVIGQHWKELDISFKKLKDARRMACEMSYLNPHWRWLCKPKSIDDIKRWYNERGIKTKIKTLSKTKRLLAVKHNLDVNNKPPILLDKIHDE